MAANVLRDGTGLVTVHLVNTSGLLGGMDEMDTLDEMDSMDESGSRATATGQNMIRQSARSLTVELQLPSPPAHPPQLHQVGIDAPAVCSHQWEAGRLTLQIPEVPRYAIIEIRT